MHCIFQALQNEIGSLQDQIAKMMKASQQTLSDTNIESQNFMKQAITDLSERLKVLELQARQKHEQLMEKDEMWNDYKVRPNVICFFDYLNLC